MYLTTVFVTWRAFATAVAASFVMLLLPQGRLHAQGSTTPMAGMAMAPDPLGVPMERLGSGTSWIPEAVSIPSREFVAGTWNLMLHGMVFAQYDVQSGTRGANQVGSLNWGMLMASHELAGGRFQARTMLSLDALTVTNRGYPLLLQSGEAYHGSPLHDRQHPHDFWMEVDAMYDRPITKSLGISLYAAPSGEPALGPVAFMHRPSAMDIPSAPIGHHWEDATHITFGVLTAGLFTHDWRLEGSAFNSREPDDERWHFDPIKLDSYSGRASYNPNAHWALNASYGYLKSPEALTPDVSMHRVTASAMYGQRIGIDGQFATTLILGANKHSDRPALSQAVLLESEAVLDKSNTLIGRVELVQKTAEDLVLDTPPFQFPSAQSFNVGTLSLGYIREILPLRFATVGLGAMGTLNVVPQTLQFAYGSRTPVGAFFFLRLRPITTKHADMGSMHGMTGMNTTSTADRGGIR
ncbi:MAG: hypothetical protein ABI205_11890 [Gemmatimonadaceae bacterium]